MYHVRNCLGITGLLLSSTMLVVPAWAADQDEASGSAPTDAKSPSGVNRGPATSEVPVTENLRQVLPTARIATSNGRVSRIHGPSLARGYTPGASAEAFRATVLGAFGATGHDLRPMSFAQGQPTVVSTPDPIGLMFDESTHQYKYFLYRYGQHVGGIPVHDAQLSILVKNGADNPVVWTNSSLRNLANFTPPHAPRVRTADVAKSLDAARAFAARRTGHAPLPTGFDKVDQPELVIFAGEGDDNVPPRLAIRYSARDSQGGGPWHFVADAHSGDILHTHSFMEPATSTVSGTVRANVTLNPVAADCAPEQSVPLEYSEVGITGGTAPVFTSATGSFSLSTSTTPVEVYSTMHGRWVDVINYPGTDERLTSTAWPPAQIQFLQNAADNQEFVIAQANAYYHVNLARDFLLRYLPNYPYISTTEHLSVIVNGDETSTGYHGMPGLCPGSAYHFDWHQILFCKRGNGVRNTAYGTIAYHEFGHEIVQDGGSDQGQYGEGFGDAYALLMTGDPRIGIGFNDTDCTNVRRDATSPVCQYDAANCTTNCGDATDTHGCGRLFSGIVWDLREALRATHPNDYQSIVTALVLNSVHLHTGMQIDPNIEIDFLTLDDNDGNIDNGTPHAAEICGAFAHHGIPCPIALPRPCDGICSKAVAFSWTNSYQSGSLGTGAICRETSQPITGGNCGNFASGRTLSVNGATMTCNGQNWASIPARRNGGYCVTTGAGNYSWAYYTAW